MSLVRALVTQNKRLSVRLSRTIIIQLKVSMCFNKRFCRGNCTEMNQLPLTPGRLGCQCSTSLWLHCTADETSVFLRLEWSDPLSWKKNNKKTVSSSWTAFSVLRYINVSSVVPDRLSNGIHLKFRLACFNKARFNQTGCGCLRRMFLCFTKVYYFSYLGDCRY